MDSLKNICAVVVWYNPNHQCVNNIISYISYVSHTYIIDNSFGNNSYLIEDLKNVTYVPNLNNLGIAKAQNIACELAFNEGFDWCLMMDQDSYWDEKNLKKFFFLIENTNSQVYLSFAPNRFSDFGVVSFYQDFKNLIKKIIKYEKKEIIHADQEVIDFCIASGNIFNIKVWKEVHGFNEDFFIDEVDTEFCFKIVKKFGKCILQFNNVYMNHCIGNPKKTLFVRNDYHTGVRLYYMVRNTLYLTKLYPDYDKKWQRRKFLKKILWQNIRDFRFNDVKFMIKGYFAYKNNEVGAFKS